MRQVRQETVLYIFEYCALCNVFSPCLLPHICGGLATARLQYTRRLNEPCCAMLYCIVLCSTVLHCTVLFCSAQDRLLCVASHVQWRYHCRARAGQPSQQPQSQGKSTAAFSSAPTWQPKPKLLRTEQCISGLPLVPWHPRQTIPQSTSPSICRCLCRRRTRGDLQVHAYGVCDSPKYFYDFVQDLFGGLAASPLQAEDLVHVKDVSLVL